MTKVGLLPYEPKALFGAFPRVYVDPLRPELAGELDRVAYAARFPDWCKPVFGREQPWFRVGATVYWGSGGRGCGRCRAWIDEGKSKVVASASHWRDLKMRLATLHGVAVEAVEIRPNLPVWVFK